MKIKIEVIVDTEVEQDLHTIEELIDKLRDLSELLNAGEDEDG